MRKKLSKSNILIAQKGISLVVVFATLLTAFVAIAPWTYGWFAKNNTVTASGMHTQAYKSDFGVAYAVKPDGATTFQTVDDPEDLFNSIVAPGQSVEVQVTITNKRTNKYTVDFTGFGLEAPNAAQDVPKIETVTTGNSTSTYYRYLSTELTTQLISVSVTNGGSYSVDSNSGPVFLRGTTSGTQGVDLEASRHPGAAGRIDYIDAVTQTNGEKTKISVPVGGSVTFTIRVSFVNTNYDQNIYKNFASGGKCERTFFFTFEEDMSTSN